MDEADIYGGDIFVPEFDEPFVSDDAGAYHNHSINTFEDRLVVCFDETNDDNDDGWPDGSVEVWETKFPTLEAALKHAGHKTHRGVSGVLVRVYVDGEERT